MISVECRAELPAEPVERASLYLDRVDDVQRGHRLPLRVFRVRHRVANHVLQKHLQHTTHTYYLLQIRIQQLWTDGLQELENNSVKLKRILEMNLYLCGKQDC